MLMLQGILANALGLDISMGLLDTARTEAKAIGASQALTYQVFPPGAPIPRKEQKELGLQGQG